MTQGSIFHTALDQRLMEETLPFVRTSFLAIAFNISSKISFKSLL